MDTPLLCETQPQDEPGYVSQYDLKSYYAARGEQESRRCEALKLYEPLPFQQAYHACMAKEALLQKGNQVGGSLAGFVEVARAITGTDPFNKYPKRDGVVVCLGFGEKHIGRVIHKYLFRAGAFRIIRDRATNVWRTYRPWPESIAPDGRHGDLERKDESKLAPPLIPARFIDGKMSWEKRSEFVFSYVRFTTGWELHALNSAGEASQAQGFQVDLYHIDEDTATPGWLEEAIGRTAIRKGKIRWTALPHAKTEDMMTMIERAEEQEEDGVPLEDRSTIRIKATMYDNPYYPEESKRQNEAIWRSQGEDVYRKRALGDVVIDSVLMYPTFNRRIHDAMHADAPNQIQQIMIDSNGEPPADWCKYMIVDPGHTVCAVTFWATPPPELGEFRVCYDELYLRNCDKFMFAKYVKHKTNGRCFQDFIIDAHGGRLRELGSGILPKRQYEMAMETERIRCVARGSRFMPGSDDVRGREEKVREWLSMRPDSTTKFLVVARNCPNLVRELERFKKKTVKVGGQDVPTDDGNRRANSHAVETFEYGAAHGLVYVKPKSSAKHVGSMQWVKEQRKRRAAKVAIQNWRPGMSHRSLGPVGAE